MENPLTCLSGAVFLFPDLQQFGFSWNCKITCTRASTAVKKLRRRLWAFVTPIIAPLYLLFKKHKDHVCLVSCNPRIVPPLLPSHPRPPQPFISVHRQSNWTVNPDQCSLHSPLLYFIHHHWLSTCLYSPRRETVPPHPFFLESFLQFLQRFIVKYLSKTITANTFWFVNLHVSLSLTLESVRPTLGDFLHKDLVILLISLQYNNEGWNSQ